MVYISVCVYIYIYVYIGLIVYLKKELRDSSIKKCKGEIWHQDINIYEEKNYLFFPKRTYRSKNMKCEARVYLLMRR